MKINFTKVLALFVAIAIFGIYACDDDNADSTAVLNLSMNVDGADFITGQDYEINGTVINFQTVGMYIGGLKLKDGGTTTSFTDKYILFNQSEISAPLGDIDLLSSIDEMEFFIGVDALTNSQSDMDFTERTADDPLSIQDPSMHWAWVLGYKFVRVDAMVDTDGDGVTETPVAYHLGSDAMLKNFSRSLDISVADGDNDINLSFNIADFFANTDLSTELDTHTGNNLPLAERLRDNLEVAISVN